MTEIRYMSLNLCSIFSSFMNSVFEALLNSDPWLLVTTLGMLNLINSYTMVLLLYYYGVYIHVQP